MADKHQRNQDLLLRQVTAKLQVDTIFLSKKRKKANTMLNI
jgi:hypothetical protein